MLSRREWTERAIERVLRVPAGFMRDRTQARVEELAEERGAEKVDLALVEAGIEVGLQQMKEMVGGASPEMKAHDAAAKGDSEAQECPVDHEAEAASASAGNGKGNASAEGWKPALNEVSVITEMERRRRELEASAGDDHEA